jgi:hypothetical protein
MYNYFPEETTYAVLLRVMVSIKIKISRTVFEKIAILCVRGPSE